MKVLEVVHSAGALEGAQNTARQIWDELHPLPSLPPPNSPDEIQDELNAMIDSHGGGQPEGEEELPPVDDEHTGEEEDGVDKGVDEDSLQTNVRSVNRSKVSVVSLPYLLNEREISGHWVSTMHRLGYRYGQLYFKKVKFIVNRRRGLQQLNVRLP